MLTALIVLSILGIFNRRIRRLFKRLLAKLRVKLKIKQRRN